MTLGSQEHDCVMEQWERRFKTKPAREPKGLWSRGNVYCNGDVNAGFLAFREGYAFAKAVYQAGQEPAA